MTVLKLNIPSQVKWIRTCQECGYKGFYQRPNPDNKNETWRDTKCRRCRSEALDYGREFNTNEDNSDNED